MSIHSRLLLAAIVFTLWFPAGTATAQRGSLIEDLFRTVAEAQLQREREKQLERQSVDRNQIQRQPTLPANPPANSISVGSREMASFAESLSGFSKEIGFLISDLQPFAADHPEIRPILPAVYQVSSDAAALLRACNGLSRVDPIVDRYAALDSRWRTLSFQLRSTPSLTAEMQSHVRACDRLISGLGRQVGVSPQMDRHGLHDKMIIAATYMQAMLDDLQVSNLPASAVHEWSHDGRLLRQELLRTADEVEQITYEDITTRFNDFALRWRNYSAPIRQTGNPHLNQRLDRIGQCADETYALLWLQPPVSTVDLAASVARLKVTTSQLMDQLTLRALASLDRIPRDAVEDGTRAMYREARHLDESMRAGGDTRELREHFVEYDRAWMTTRQSLSQMDRINGSLIAAIDRDCQYLRRALRVEATGPVPVRMDELVGLAASLEGSAEYFKADIQRYENYLSPAGFRRSITRAADDFHNASKRLHAGLFENRDLRLLSRDSEKLVDAWQRLSDDVAQLRTHGLTGRRAMNLENASRDLAPLVAKVSAALLQ
jgi:hypothetical protein